MTSSSSSISPVPGAPQVRHFADEHPMFLAGVLVSNLLTGRRVNLLLQVGSQFRDALRVMQQIPSILWRINACLQDLVRTALLALLWGPSANCRFALVYASPPRRYAE